MEIATEEDTLRFLEGLWFLQGQAIIKAIVSHYKLNPEQEEALEDLVLKPNDWTVTILPPL
jgi:hypothetical protein